MVSRGCRSISFLLDQKAVVGFEKGRKMSEELLDRVFRARSAAAAIDEGM